MYFKNKDDIQITLRKAKLLHIWKYIENYVKSTIEFKHKIKNDTDIKIGASKIGGNPDLPEGTIWPKFYEHTQSFFAQINLKDLEKYDTENLLPKEGILYFFYDLFSYTSKDNYGKAGKVIFSTNTNNLFRTDPPKDILLDSEKDYEPQITFKSAITKFSSGLTIPYMNQNVIEDLKEKGIVSEDEIFDNYFEKVFDSVDDAEISNRLLGHSENIQNDMEPECCYLESKLDWWKLSEKEKEESREYLNNWVLLFQISYIPELDLHIHDGGAIYYWIQKNDLKEKRFDKVWVTMQCG